MKNSDSVSEPICLLQFLKKLKTIPPPTGLINHVRKRDFSGGY
jgi:hypothetical protein